MRSHRAGFPAPNSNTLVPDLPGTCCPLYSQLHHLWHRPSHILWHRPLHHMWTVHHKFCGIVYHTICGTVHHTICGTVHYTSPSHRPLHHPRHRSLHILWHRPLHHLWTVHHTFCGIVHRTICGPSITHFVASSIAPSVAPFITHFLASSITPSVDRPSHILWHRSLHGDHRQVARTRCPFALQRSSKCSLQSPLNFSTSTDYFSSQRGSKSWGRSSPVRNNA